MGMTHNLDINLELYVSMLKKKKLTVKLSMFKDKILKIVINIPLISIFSSSHYTIFLLFS